MEFFSADPPVMPTAVLLSTRLRRCGVLTKVMFVLVLLQQTNTAQNGQSAVRSEILLRSSSSWDGEPYHAYLPGRPELSILRITIPPRTRLGWHSHPMPNAAYIVAGELTLERKKDGKKQHFKAGQVIPETVNTLHRGMTGNESVVVIVFYAGNTGVSLTQCAPY